MCSHLECHNEHRRELVKRNSACDDFVPGYTTLGVNAPVLLENVEKLKCHLFTYRVRYMLVIL